MSCSLIGKTPFFGNGFISSNLVNSVMSFYLKITKTYWKFNAKLVINRGSIPLKFHRQFLIKII